MKLNHKVFSQILIILAFISSSAIGQVNDTHDHDDKVQLAFQCAVCSNHLGYVEPNSEIKGGFALSAHKHSLVEVEGLYQCNACKTPIFKAKNTLDIPADPELLYFSRPINNSKINIVPYDNDYLVALKEHCPECANKLANSHNEVVNGNFGSKISFKNLKGLFKN